MNYNNMNKEQLLELIRECVNEVILEAQPIQNRLQSLNIHIDNVRKSMSDPTLTPERKSKLSKTLNRLTTAKSELQKKVKTQLPKKNEAISLKKELQEFVDKHSKIKITESMSFKQVKNIKQFDNACDTLLGMMADYIKKYGK